eukprot:scaffold44093_cov31-Tisochrysis_lutea.AAC.6
MPTPRPESQRCRSAQGLRTLSIWTWRSARTRAGSLRGRCRARGASVERVLEHLLERAGGPQDDFARGDPVHHLLRERADGARRLGGGRGRHGRRAAPALFRRGERGMLALASLLVLPTLKMPWGLGVLALTIP